MKNDRRNFIRFNIFAGVWAAASAWLPYRAAASYENARAIQTRNMESLLEHYVQCLGGPFPEPGPLNAVLGETIEKDGYRIERITYEVQPGEPVGAFLLIPDGVSREQPAPGIAVWHQHNGEYHLGKSEPAGLAGNPMHHTAVALVKEGYVVLCPDALCFEDRQDPTGKLQGNDYERFEFLRQVVRSRSLAWKNILDMKRAIDYLGGRPEVVTASLGCYGHSMGSTHSWLVGPLEPRLKCVIGNCCLPTYDAIEANHLIHCFPNFVPGWKTHGDTPEIVALIAPRALHLNFGEEDPGTPITYARHGLENIEKAYRESGVPEKFTYYIEPGAGHVLTATMWEHVKTTFEKYLKS